MRPKKWGIAIFVHDWYLDFIPTFVYSSLRAYPYCFVKIFSHTPLSERLNRLLKTIRNGLSSNFSVIENSFSDRKPHGYLRWFLPYDHLQEFDGARIHDADVILLKEKPSLFDFHMERCKKFDIPYSNFVRKRPEDHPPKLTGWHFVQPGPYYEKMQPILNEILSDPNFDIASPPNVCYPTGDGTMRWDDEPLLYQIVHKAIGIPRGIAEDVGGNYAHHHGIHLGPMRGGICDRLASPDETLKESAESQLGLNLKYWQRVDDILQIIDDPLFQLIHDQTQGKPKHLLNKFVAYFKNSRA